ncbi:hypothetical protein K8I61_10970 [bacterium]|nr:hypothetical protein [bacterium]
MRRVSAIAFTLALSLAAAGCRIVDPGEPLPEIRENVQPKMLQQLGMANVVRKAFALYPDFDKLGEIPPEISIPEIGDVPIFVSVFHTASPMIWGVGTSGTTQERLLDAATMVMRNEDFARYYLVNRDKLAVKIDIVTRLRPAKIRGDGSGTAIEPGIHGLALKRGDDVFYQLPADYITLGWEAADVGPAERKLRMLAELSDQAGLGEKGWRTFQVSRMSTFSFLQKAPDFAPVVLYRGNPSIQRYSTQDVQDAALRAGRHILQNVEPGGRFRMGYDPIRNESAGFLEYDPAYHAAAIYGLSVLFQYSKRLEIIDQTKAPLLWLVRHLDDPVMEPEASHVEFLGNAKTSSTAMTLLAITAMPPIVMEELGPANVNRLAYYLTLMRDEAGRVFPTYFHKLAGYMPRRAPFYTEGPALMALARYYERSPNVDWIAAARTLADRQIAAFEKTGAYDTWTIQGLADMWRIEKDERYARAALEMADRVFDDQFVRENVRYGDYIGGFDNAHPPKTFSTAIRAEALVAAERLARASGVDPSRYQEAVLRATGFLLNTQFTKDNSYYTALPDETIGAFRQSLVDSDIRLNAQIHAIVALCGAFDVQADVLANRRDAQGGDGEPPDEPAN